jgi:hypothetical protein
LQFYLYKIGNSIIAIIDRDKLYLKGRKEAVGDIDWMGVWTHEKVSFYDGHQVFHAESTVARGAVG